MPTGRTLSGRDASGGIVLIYSPTNPVEYITGEETTYVTKDKAVAEKFRTSSDETIYQAFESPGLMTSEEDVSAARRKFVRSCKELEAAYVKLGRVTFGNLKQSSKPGIISAKPRFVETGRRGKVGFPKGSFETTDASIDAGALREVFEETAIQLDPSRLEDTGKMVNPGGDSYYVIFKYRLTVEEYNHYKAHLRIKHLSTENELQNVAFRSIPQNTKAFFTNKGSLNAFTMTRGWRGGRRRRTYKKRRTV
jgi:8-oxo-dGTP pyrophosphatase MutT (NUDIX family)